MKVHKVTLMIVDHGDVGQDEIQGALEGANYPNDCILPHVMRMEQVEIGEWSDDHPLNTCHVMDREFERLFAGRKPT